MSAKLRVLKVLVAVSMVFATMPLAGPAVAVSDDIVVSQIYGGGGNSGATLRNDFIELFNRSANPVDVSGWSVQYASATGTTWQVTVINGTIAPGAYYLVQEAAGAGGTADLPTPNAIGNISMSGVSGKVALVNTATALSGSCPAGSVDQVGYGGSNCSEGSGAAPGLSNATAAVRANDGCTETDDNAADFAAAAPNPRNSASPTIACTGPTDPSGVGAADPDPVTAGNQTLLTVAITPGTNPPSTGLAVAGDLSSIGESATQDFFDDATNGDAAAGDNVFSYLATVDAGTTPGAASLPVTITDAQSRTGSTSIAFTVNGSGAVAALVINEIDYDQAGTDASEFVEIRNDDGDPVDLSAYSLVLVNGSGGGATVYDTIDLPAVDLAPGEHFVVCANAATVANCDLDDGPDTNFIQNGAPDAVAIVSGATIVDTVSYEGDTGAPYTEGSGAGLVDDPGIDNAGISRCPNGADTDQNNVDLSLRAITPGAPNACLPAVVINEIDYDQPGTDTAEFLEIRNNDIFTHDLDLFTLELVNGNGGGATVYDTIDLPAVDLAPGEHFVVCANAATVANCDLDDGPDTNFIQNGAPDAAGLRYDGVLIDAISYEGDTGAPYTEGSGSGLADPGAASDVNIGISRCDDGTDTDQNNVDLSTRAITPGAANNCAVDAAPAVVSTVPPDGQTDAAIATDITIEFSEPVTVSGSWFDITCDSSGTHTATVTGGPTTYMLDPDVDFDEHDNCTVMVFASQVTDQDGSADPMAADYSFMFTAIDACAAPYTLINDVQGSGASAAITGPVSVQGVVVGDYEGPSPELRGFYLQSLDDDADGDAATSEGIFVFNFDNDDVDLGDVVRVSGNAGEFQDQTQISGVTSIAACGTGTVDPVDVTLPLPSPDYYERYEGMLVRMPQTLYVTEHFQLGRFGQVVMSSDGRLQQPTNVVAPGALANALQAQNDLNRIIFDDDLQSQNPDPILFGRNGNPLSASNTLRGGDTATDTVGVMTYTWAGNAASGNAFRLRPIDALGGSVDFVAANPRPASPPTVGGTLKVVGVNLLNFFNTFDGIPDNVDNCSNGVTGGAADCRGADTQAEFDRQWPKTVEAILEMDPDVLGVNEIENDGYGPDSAIQFLVDRLNDAAGAGTYAVLDVDAATGQLDALGNDAIKVGLIYQPVSVTPVGTTAALNTDAFIDGGDSAPRNRASLLQAFEQNATGATVVVNVNHLKSKGSACDAPDAGDGQGNCNNVRVNAVDELLSWFATDPTGTGDPDLLLIGDYNAYAMEDPITTLENGGFTNLVASFLGPDAYSFVFDGQWGYLDQALAATSLVSQVTGVADYHISADEPSVLDYNTDFKSPDQITSLYAADEFRVSDHDPVIIGLELNAPPTVTVSPAGQKVQYSDPIDDVTITATDVSSDLPLAISTEWSVDGASFASGLPGGLAVVDDGCGATTCSWTLSGEALTAPGAYVVRVTVEDGNGDTTMADIEIEGAQENAWATYTGPTYLSTMSPTSSDATVPLSATIEDISVTSSAADDLSPGVITNATVTFVDRDTRTPITGCVDLTVIPLISGDLTTGTAACDWDVSISGDAESFTIGIVVDGFYTRDSAEDDSLVTVTKPLGTEFISGGGYLLMSDSAGELAADPGTKANFGFNVKYKPRGKSPKGKVNFIIRRVEADGLVHTYQIKSNALTSLAVQAGDGTATLGGKANVTDITDSENPVELGGNNTIQLIMDDNGEPGSSDTLGITLWNKDGGLLYSSSWNGAKTVEAALGGGNLKVR